MAPSYASKLVVVMRELQRRRQATNAFAGKHGFITPRDLFRWAERHAVGYQVREGVEERRGGGAEVC